MDKALYPYLLFWSIGLLCFLAEWRFPARPIAYRSVFWRDLIALGLYNVSFLAVVQATDRIPIPNYMPAVLYNLPTVVKLAFLDVYKRQPEAQALIRRLRRLSKSNPSALRPN